TKHAAAPRTPDQKLVSDIDLAILGADLPRFDAYEEQIRREYAWVGDEEFRTTRKAILEGFLDRPSIYLTPYFHERFEAIARHNLARSLEKLEAR
ncbi:MAG: N-methyl-D-aspartate receptor NMDAR2C subunit, partial [Gammaproteobacteria bacterium]